MSETQDVCTAKGLHHVAIAVKDIHDTLKFYQEVFGVGPAKVEDVPDQRVLGALIKVGGAHLEIIQPTDEESGVARFVLSRGEGVHHICFEVEDIQGKLDLLTSKGFQMIDTKARPGLSGMIGFIHPRSTRGVLIELAEPPAQATAS